MFCCIKTVVLVLLLTVHLKTIILNKILSLITCVPSLRTFLGHCILFDVQCPVAAHFNLPAVGSDDYDEDMQKNNWISKKQRKWAMKRQRKIYG